MCLCEFMNCVCGCVLCIFLNPVYVFVCDLCIHINACVCIRFHERISGCVWMSVYDCVFATVYVCKPMLVCVIICVSIQYVSLGPSVCERAGLRGSAA